jgi:precorrin-8X/cobalt-precorrin-8 methylmutase
VYGIQEQEEYKVSFIMNPMEIEKRSFEIISGKLDGRQFDPQNVNVIKRVIHATADFDYADNLVFSDGAVAAAKDAIKNGARIVTDTQMAKAGINKKAVDKFGCDLHCFIDKPEVAEIARAKGVTRALAAVDHAAETLKNPILFVIGNAPTALIRLHELITSGAFFPVMIIAVPVGFVNVVESKELILTLQVPHIVAKGQKGGSNVAAAICNALLYEITE